MCLNELLNKCSDINKPYGNLCFPDAVKNINIKVFHLLSKTNETRCMSVHEKCACKCRLQESVLMIGSVRQVINADVYVKNGLTKVGVIIVLFRILVCV